MSQRFLNTREHSNEHNHLCNEMDRQCYPDGAESV
nr:MAG TPA: hypothetical protein [Caudoviricetes sp.]